MTQVPPPAVGRTRRHWMRRRLLAAYALLLPLLCVAGASPAMAAVHRSDGDDPGTGISTLAAIGLYAGIPLIVAVVLALLTFGPSSTRGPRYRPSAGWNADPTWLGGPAGGAHSTSGPAGGAHSTSGPAGGAHSMSANALDSISANALESADPDRPPGTGGARGTW